jgi:hypothetical protein
VLEYIAAIKSVLDILKGVKTLKDDISRDAHFFDSVVSPTYRTMSTIVSNYIELFHALEIDLNTPNRSEQIVALRTFAANRRKTLPLRREIVSRCKILIGDKKFARFHKFFEYVENILVISTVKRLGNDQQIDQKWSVVDENLACVVEGVLTRVLSPEGRDEIQQHGVSAGYVGELINKCSQLIDSQWIRLSDEYARLEVDIKIG